MNAIDNSQAQAVNVLDQFATPVNDEAAGDNELGKDEFLKLLVTQLENQNPLEPQDNGEFIAQLAQFSSLEGIDNLNDSMNGLVATTQSSQAIQASSLVGQQVQVSTDYTYFQQGGLLTGVAQLPASSPDVKISLYDEQGTLVRNYSLGSQPGGNIDFVWDGMDGSGNTLPSGIYKVKAEAQIDGEYQQLGTLLGANVNSVTLGQGGEGMTLNLAGIGSVPFTDVKTIQ